jgi:hypothetical protein
VNDSIVVELTGVNHLTKKMAESAVPSMRNPTRRPTLVAAGSVSLPLEQPWKAEFWRECYDNRWSVLREIVAWEYVDCLILLHDDLDFAEALADPERELDLYTLRITHEFPSFSV